MAGLNKSNVKKIRDLNPHNYFKDNEFEEFLGIAYNSIKIRPTDPNFKFGYVQEDFIKNQLLKSNYVGFDKLSGLFSVIYTYGLNEYWLPKYGTFVFPDGRSYTRALDYEPNKIGAYCIRALPTELTIARLIKRSTDKIAMGEALIRQNLPAVATPFIVQVRDKDVELSIKQAIQQRQEGKPVIVIDTNIADGIKGIQTYTEFISPQVDELNDKERNRLLNRLGTMTANINKRERVQATEVNATVGQCEDYLYILIDNVNNQFKTYGIPLVMEINNSLEELYANESNQEKSENKEETT